MKHPGAKAIYEKERNEDLMKAYREELAACSVVQMPDIYKKVVNRKTKRFYVSEERAAIVIAKMMKGDKLYGMRDTKIDMYNEIYKRVVAMKKKHPDMSTYDLTFKVVQQPAPKFYMTPGSAKVTICKIKKAL